MLSQTAAAAKASVSLPTWTRVERDSPNWRMPSSTNAVAIARALNWPPDALDRLAVGEDPSSFEPVEPAPEPVDIDRLDVLGQDLAILDRVGGRAKSKSVTVCPPGCVEVRHRKFPKHDGSKRGRERLFASIEADELERWRQRARGDAPATMTEAFERWTARAISLGDMAESTAMGYRGRWRRRLHDAFGSMAPEEVTTALLARHRDMLTGKLAPSSVNQDLAIVRGTLAWCAEQGVDS